MTLIDRLRRLGQLWADAHGKELSTLGTLVAKDGKFFGRLAEGKTCTVAIFERFLTFFRDPANWPEQTIPGAAASDLDQLEMIAAQGDGVRSEMQISSHDLMADDGSAKRSGGEDGTSPFAGAPDSPAPSSATCSETIVPAVPCTTIAAASTHRSSTGRRDRRAADAA